MLALIQDKLAVLEDSIETTKATNTQLEQKRTELQASKAEILAHVDECQQEEEALNHQCQQLASKCASVASEQRTHKNQVKARKQKIISIRDADSNDLEQTTAQRLATQAKLDDANTALLKSIPGLEDIFCASEDDDERCAGDEEYESLQTHCRARAPRSPTS